MEKGSVILERVRQRMLSGASRVVLSAGDREEVHRTRRKIDEVMRVFEKEADAFIEAHKVKEPYTREIIRNSLFKQRLEEALSGKKEK